MGEEAGNNDSMNDAADQRGPEDQDDDALISALEACCHSRAAYFLFWL